MEYSRAFNEFIMQRCEEILENDDAHNQLNTEIILIEKQLFKCLNPQQIELLQQLDELKEKQAINDYCRIYMAGYNDKK